MNMGSRQKDIVVYTLSKASSVKYIKIFDFGPISIRCLRLKIETKIKYKRQESGDAVLQCAMSMPSSGKC